MSACCFGGVFSIRSRTSSSRDMEFFAMTKTVDDLRGIYSTIMGEIKLRSEVIKNTLDMTSMMGPGPRCELCWLQLRMICELIALACLAAHGDLAATRTQKLHSAHEADRILKALEKLHPKFFPIPAREIKTREGKVTGYLEAVPGTFFTKADVLKLYWECSAHLHKKPLNEFEVFHVKASEPKKIHTINTKLRGTLAQHRIILSTPNESLWVEMHGGPDMEVRTSLVWYGPEQA